MSGNQVWFALSGLYAVMVTSWLCQHARAVGTMLRLMDRPSAIKHHRRPTPLIGGIAILAVLIPLLPMFTVIFEPEGLGNRALSVIVIVSALMALLGVADDRSNLTAFTRFAVKLIVFAVAMQIEPKLIVDQIRITGWRESISLIYPVAFVMTLLIYVGFINSVNMADGKNGLVIGMCIIWMLSLLTVGPRGLIIVDLPLVLMLGVLMVYNLQGRLFLGDGGTYGLASFLAMMSIYAYHIADGRVMADTLALLYLVPCMDMLRLFFARIVAKRSPFSGDRNHLHHLLQDVHGWRRGILTYLGLIAVPIALGFLFPHKLPYIFVGGLLAYSIIIAALFRARRHLIASRQVARALAR